MLKFILTLAAVCMVAALILAGVYNLTSPLIAAQKIKESNQALSQVVPDADTYKLKTFSKGNYYECYKGSKLIGYAVFAQGAGYAGVIKLLVGVDRKGTITGVEVLTQSETPGLGARATEIKQGEKAPWFLSQFKGKEAHSLNLNDVETITGATITSEAILLSVKSYIVVFLKEIK